jgi:hypothetical protein
MVTRTVGMNVRQCNCDTVLAMIDHSNLADRNRLKTLYNLEVYAHSVAALRAGRLDRSTFKGFFIAFDPLRYALLEALAAMLPPFINSVRGIRRYLGSGAVR